MKIVVIADTHFGVRSDLEVFQRKMKKFFEEQFFPYIDEHEIDTVIHLGDLFDKRFGVSFTTSELTRSSFIEPLNRRKINTHIIIGNHDCYYRTTNRINSVDQLYDHGDYPYLNIVDQEPFELDDILLVPWIAKDNHDTCMEAISNTKCSVVMGHFEIQGFQMYKGTESRKGKDRSIFSRFDKVFSGHFHHRSTERNITYLGAPYEMKWNDWNDPRGFGVYDTETKEMMFIDNPDHTFHRIDYSDTDYTLDMIENLDTDEYVDGYVRIVVKDKTDPQIFDAFHNKILTSGAVNVKVVDLTLRQQRDDGDEDVVISDTKTHISNSVDSIKNIDESMRKSVKKLINNLYEEVEI